MIIENKFKEAATVVIDPIRLDKTHKHYGDCLQLEKDAKRVVWQASELARLNPAKSESYDRQLKYTLASIADEVNRLTKGKAKLYYKFQKNEHNDK